jgi:vanillate O-demethylase ferredoxin subunit
MNVIDLRRLMRRTYSSDVKPSWRLCAPIMSGANETIQTRLHSIIWAAQDIQLYELRSLSGPLPSYTPGAHIDVHLPRGMIRSYSLVDLPGTRDRYVIAVSRDPASRGGSHYMHDTMRVGDTIPISGPRNNFELLEAAPHSVFIAGGIGITPLWCMIQRVAELRASWELHYSARSADQAAFLDEIAALGKRAGGDVHTHFNDQAGGRLLDLAAAVQRAPTDAHLYCCGPLPMLDAFQAACGERPKDHVHVEYFSAPVTGPPAGGFVVSLARTGKRVAVPKGQSILDALLAAGVDVPYSCNEGICGSCETRVIAGIPDHRDVVLTDKDKESGHVMMICCSGSKSEELVLDL